MRDRNVHAVMCDRLYMRHVIFFHSSVCQVCRDAAMSSVPQKLASVDDKRCRALMFKTCNANYNEIVGSYHASSSRQLILPYLVQSSPPPPPFSSPVQSSPVQSSHPPFPVQSGPVQSNPPTPRFQSSPVTGPSFRGCLERRAPFLCMQRGCC